MAIEYTPQDSSPPVTAIDYEPQNTSGLVSDPAEGGSFSASNEAELAGAQSFAAKAKEAQNAAEQSETNAATSESNAASSEANAATSESNAATSASNAATSETNAATSETNAATSESNASTSEANALASATTAQNLEVTSASFDTADGTLTLTKANSGTITTDLDGRYLTTHQDITGKADLSGAMFTGDISAPNIGIGTSTPHSHLTIHKDNSEYRVTQDTFVQNGTFVYSYNPDTSTYGTILTRASDHRWMIGSDEKMRIDDTGYVGINNNNPSEALDVTGNSVVSGDATVGGELTVSGSAEAELFKGDIEGAVHFKGAVASGATLTKSDVVYVSGYSGGKTVVGLADASDSSKMPAFGIVAADPVGVNVDVVTFGTLKSIDTSTYTDGDELYVDTTAGGLTATAPSGEGNLVQKIAKVVRAANSGNIKVMGAGRTNATPNLNNGNIFIGDSNNLATTASFATEVTNATTGKADLSGADFTGDVTTTGDLGINTTNPAHPLDVKGNVNVTYGTDPIYTTSPLLTNASSTTYSIAEITDIYYASVRSVINQSPLGDWDDNRRAVQILFNFNGTGHPTAGQKGWASADQSVVGDFINDTYSSNDISTFQSSLTAIFNGTYTLQTTIIDDILDGDYDHLVDYKVGINVDPATEALDVGGNIKASGTLATGGYTLASTDGTNGQALVTDGSGNVSFGDVTGTVDVSGKADLSGADFTGDVSVAGTFNTNNIESTINTVDYPVYSTSLDGSNAIATLGGTSTGDKVHTLEMRPAAGGVRMHWHQGGLYDGIAGTSDTTDTLRFHTTDRGIHVGDDSVGTYTAGDNQNNADVDFGMLVGRSSTNIGSNNFGFGHGLSFNSADIASCLGAGTTITFHNKTQSSIGMGADVAVGEYDTPTGDPTRKAIFAGGNVVTGSGEYSFTWAKGDWGGGSNGQVRYSATNSGTGCVLFGYQTKILSDCNYSFNGGSRGLSGDYKHQRLNDCDYTISWGFQNETDRSNSTAVFGQGNDVADSSNTIVAGLNNTVKDSKYASVTGFGNASYCYGGVIGGQSNIVGKDVVDNTDGRYSACFGFDNLVESDGNFVSGYQNNTLGHSSACIGRGLKTPLFQPNGGGDYVWDNYSITVGAYNAEATKYYTNTANTAWVTDHRFVVGTGTSVNAKDNGFIVAIPDSGFCGIIMPNLASSPTYSNDLNAKAGGVPVGGLYRDGNTVKIVLS